MSTRHIMTMLLVMGLFALGGCGAGTASGTATATSSGGASPVRTETREVSGFSALTFSGTGNITIQQTGQEKLTITAQENLIPLVTTSVSGGRLTIGYQGALPDEQKVISYALQVKQLSDIVVSGNGTVSAGGIKGGSVSVSVSGTGGVKIVGSAQDQQINVSGNGTYNGSSFATYTGTVIVSGSGSAVVNVTATLNAYVAGPGSIEYLGTPTVTKTITGTGTISPRP